jgi:hypothetical protein
MIFDKHSTNDILLSLEAEAAKALAEIRCAKRDLEQAEVRIRFLLSAVHHLKNKDI